MNQDRAPLLEALRRHREQTRASFHIHAHRGAVGAPEDLVELLGEKVFAADLTELPGLDDWSAPQGAIREAQEFAADAWGSARCRFLVNGTTSGNIAMLLAAVGRGEKILMDEEVHRSALAGIELAGAVPVRLPRRKNAGWKISEAIDAETVQNALREDPEIRAVFLVNPTYYGICSPVREIADICHAAGVPLLVDEAHGAHFHFSDLLPEDALCAGADLVAQSTHKTAGSLGQSSLLHMQGERILPERVDEKLKLITTSSPSYVLMASLDAARRQMATKGERLLDSAQRLADRARRELAGIEGLEVLSSEIWGGSKALENDPLRIVFSAASRGLTGHQLLERLDRRHGVRTELSDAHNVLAVITWGNTGEEIDCLRHAVERSLRDTKQ